MRSVIPYKWAINACKTWHYTKKLHLFLANVSWDFLSCLLFKYVGCKYVGRLGLIYETCFILGSTLLLESIKVVFVSWSWWNSWRKIPTTHARFKLLLIPHLIFCWLMQVIQASSESKDRAFYQRTWQFAIDAWYYFIKINTWIDISCYHCLPYWSWLSMSFPYPFLPYQIRSGPNVKWYTSSLEMIPFNLHTYKW